MTKKSKIIAGLEEAVRFARGDRSTGKPHLIKVAAPIDVRDIRARQGLSQAAFAEKYGFSLATLRNWEQGHRAPTGASRILLLVIDRQPKAVEAALAS